MTYQEKLKDPRWQKKRLYILERDEWACRRCKSTAETLQVHHKRYIKDKNPWDYEDSFYLTLCELCHLEEHDLMYDNIQRMIQLVKDNFWGYEVEILNSFLVRYDSKQMLGALKNG